MEQAVQQRRGSAGNWQERTPVLEWPVAGKSEAASLVGGGHQTEEQLRAGLVERGEPYFIVQDQVVAQQAVDDAADGVIGQAAVELLDELRGGAVAHAQSLLDGTQADADQHVA